MGDEGFQVLYGSAMHGSLGLGPGVLLSCGSAPKRRGGPLYVEASEQRKFVSRLAACNCADKRVA